MSREDRESRREAAPIRKARYFDYSLLFFLVVLLGVGYVMLYSTSAYTATLRNGDSAFFLKKQLFASALGAAGLIFCVVVDYHFWKHISGVLYVGSFIMCVFVLFAGNESHGQSRWIEIAGINVQPSEIGKVAVIVAMATVISKIPKQLRNMENLLKLFALILPIFGVVAANNLSTALIIFGIAFIMAFVAYPGYKPFFIIVALGGLAAWMLMMLPGMEYRFERIQVWKHPENFETGYQTLQGLYAIGSGGLFGKGLGSSIQKTFVPEARNDMIFSIICEELGLFGAICIIVLYILLIWRCLFVALNARDMFGSFLVIGIMAHIALQVIMNIAVVTNTMPNTGVTLPFISYGGTSLAITISEIGIVLSVSKGIQMK